MLFPLDITPKTSAVVATFQIQWVKEFTVLPQPFPYFERKFKSPSFFTLSCYLQIFPSSF